MKFFVLLLPMLIFGQIPQTAPAELPVAAQTVQEKTEATSLLENAVASASEFLFRHPFGGEVEQCKER